MEAKLRFSYGTMASGKSLQVLTTAHNFQSRNIPFLIFKSSIDTRDGDEIKSRIGDGVSRSCIVIKPEENIYIQVEKILWHNALVGIPKIKWILVDEAQFLTEEQVDQLGDIVDYCGIEVWCFGLRTDFKTKLFPGAKRLFEMADTIEELKSTCDCGRKNIVNAKLTRDGKLAVAGAQVDVGGDDKYTAICRKCYKDKLKEQTT